MISESGYYAVITDNLGRQDTIRFNTKKKLEKHIKLLDINDSDIKKLRFFKVDEITLDLEIETIKYPAVRTKKKRYYECGFFTSKNRFVTPQEAAQIAFESGQIKRQKNILEIEDLIQEGKSNE
ncbi:MAG: hypothetical protein EKK55_22475 [Rhodocyclaceae bacterium]|nr:MAG: hypothetical protein EKK55_22475 [Rhodocyclaceae bacterium]